MNFYSTSKSVVFSLIFMFGIWGCGDESRKSVVEEDPPLFQLLQADQTGIDFQNRLTEGLNTNILMYEYFYNGGGVATGDVNGDGLIDIYFTSNMSDNKLYLNLGNMQFTDITLNSGASGRPGPWKTGVTMVDINGDNLLDLYLSYSGAMPESKRANELFVNQGNRDDGTPIFKEMGVQYGLASTAFSNQSYFFDYDRDGDLDALMLNHNPKSLPILNVANTNEFLKVDDPFRGVRLYKQENDRFMDVTTSAGISGSALSYGLGIGISDIDGDGWPDFYISNDYAVPDYLYINNQDGTFTNELNESMGHNSQFSMGNDIADINNDGLYDVVTLDMLPEDNYRQKLLLAPDNYAKFDLNVRTGFHYQYMRNMLQLNNGNGTFSEVGQITGISNTDWSWAALLADYNNDGWKDLYVTNGYYRDYTNLDFIKYMDDYAKSKGRLVREEVLEIISHMPASDLVNYMFVNENGIRFSDVSKYWGMEHPANSNGAAYADLDNDGDLDLIVNNINQAAFIYQNESQRDSSKHFIQVRLSGSGLNTQGIGAVVSIFSQGRIQTIEQFTGRGYLSSVTPILHFGLGNSETIDSLSVSWPSGKMQVLYDVKGDQRIVLKESESGGGPIRIPTTGNSIFEEIDSPISKESSVVNVNDFNRQPLLISEISFEGPCLVKGDVNGDDLEDVFIGGASGQSASLFIRQRNMLFTESNNAVFQEDKDSDDVDASFLDVNGDGHLDLYVASGGYHNFKINDKKLQDRLYLNDGRGNLIKRSDALPPINVSTGAIAINDVNQDGFVDIFVGGRVIPGRYPEIPASYLLINDGNGSFVDQTADLAPGISKMGMVTDAIWSDLNLDGTKELIVIGEWMPLSIFTITNGKLSEVTNTYLEKQFTGWWNTLEVADFNNDQRPDLIVGNMGTNTQFSVSEDQPAELYYKDFDNNGSIDPMFCYYIQGRSYPYVTRDELLNQLAYLRSKFTSYESYANATITDIFEDGELKGAGKLSASWMETSVFVSRPDGKLRMSSLPKEVQYSPVYAIAILDHNADGNQDMLLVGNNCHAKLRLGKFDANYGVLVTGDGAGNFEYVNQSKSGFKLQGDVRSVLQVDNTLLFGINEGSIISYRLNK